MSSQKELIAKDKMDVPQEPICPHISNDNQVKSMLETNYGLTVVSLKSLNGYDDKNYHAQVSSQHSNRHLETVYDNGYLVKIVNHIDSKTPDFQFGQKLVMDTLNTSDIQCQTEIKTVDGEFFSSMTVDKDGEEITYMVSVRTFLSGDILDSITLTTSLAYDVGSLSAGICKTLQNLEEFKFFDDFTPLWNMDKFYKVKGVLHAVTDDTHREIAEEVFQAFESLVVPNRKEFRKGQIHGDLNEQNILVETTSSGIKICGLLDFQDSCKSCCIYDLAIPIAYMMMLQKSDVSLLDVGGHVLAGYNKTVQLNDAEKVCLKTVIASRMVMSLVYGAYYFSLSPSNEYFLATSHAGWKALVEFWRTEDCTLWKRWDEIIQSYISTM